ncbi:MULTISPECIES: hypothetical protein [Prochlorococcus]|uniref:Uncharacterized protein n=1 Tax=Prochlorococcus marinus (strain SARG / CCMP1375 / SS120) TaxID=167539 RepID=Q7VBU0_PROMA|nr:MULTISPECIES: hypothetical protein [Prochlorococcus]AAQ00047.1 Predicted protein [Prochlorococcus marinus subsp. marinus str. CCMP1375]KGG13844.1 hypothetical protein EV04_0329 [Prochlorococcus marinus str. LG]KGG18978.1 hypothetical protein EV08_1465 [Prochlorococcus marinus str. SS2]KGG23483.1 hypothetical protein EV09_1107 [Prochlorococcus marinus str. SS35]KGG32281.1 hypothetical protein EV10_1396 [Prochlorococcus marinus str. SS51]
MTTLEKIEYAETRIKELQLLINHWRLTELENSDTVMRVLSTSRTAENNSDCIAA